MKRLVEAITALTVAGCIIGVWALPGAADPDVEDNDSPKNPEIVIENDEYEPGGSEEAPVPEDAAPVVDDDGSVEWEYDWRSPCGAIDAICQASLTCGEPGQTRWLLYGRVPPGSWEAMG